MVNPFCSSSDVEILKEAFPTLHISIIEDKLISVNGDVNRAFELLLQLTDPSQATSNGTAVPNTIYNSFDTRSSPGVMIPPVPSIPNPFISAKPLTVREELAQWRQDLRIESSRRASNNNRVSTPNLHFSNGFKSNAGRSSFHEQHGRSNDNRGQYVSSAHSVPQINFQRPLIPEPITGGSLSNRMYSNSTPNVNYHLHSRSMSNPSSATLSPPTLPRRHQSSNSLNNNSITNPFVPGATPTTHRPVPNIPPTNPNHRESSTADNDASGFNPFEEAELPPPAYSEIQRDTVINLAP